MNKKPTEYEHYIAQVHLKGFSPQYEQYKKNKKTKCFIYYYDLIKDFQQQAVPIDSVCFEKNLYEFTDKEGNIALTNLVENYLWQFETMFSGYRNELESKAFNEENCKTKCFLRTEEKRFWITYILLQMLRIPQVLEKMQEIIQKIIPEIGKQQAKNLSIFHSFPFWGEAEENSLGWDLLSKLVDPMLNMSFSICVDKKGRFITSDKAMYINAPNLYYEEYEKVVFPITSEICLILLGGEAKKHCSKKNGLFFAKDEFVWSVFKDISSSAYEKIYANHELTPKELELLTDVFNSKYS